MPVDFPTLACPDKGRLLANSEQSARSALSKSIREWQIIQVLMGIPTASVANRVALENGIEPGLS